MAQKSTIEPDEGRAVAGAAPPPPTRVRLPLATVNDVRRELARLYREGKTGQREPAEVSKLANVLSILGRLIEAGDFEARIDRLEQGQ